MITRHSKFVFDLDDTLYSERDYSISALQFFGHRCEELKYSPDTTKELIACYKTGEINPINVVCLNYGIPDKTKYCLIAEMQAHTPKINLRSDAEQLLEKLRAEDIDYSIVTDGRSVTQRAKISALGLNDAKLIMISEEIGTKKPNSKAFIKIAENHPSANYLYVGDNPRKDFIAPNKLGWLSVMLRDRGINIHSQEGCYEHSAKPKLVINSLTELIEFL